MQPGVDDRRRRQSGLDWTADEDVAVRRPAWRRIVAATVALAFALILILMGFVRHAHHAADADGHSVFSSA
jgi:hypothetical protein